MASEQPYILGDGLSSAETSRLDEQHVMLRKVAGGQLVPDDIAAHLATIPSPRIADVGTGTAAWLIDMGARLPATTALAGFDIADDTFPAPESRPANLSLHMHNATQPFPEEHVGRYDLVHARLLVYGLKKGEWEVVARNMHALLKPGGRLLWEETGYTSWSCIPPHPALTEVMEVDQAFAKKVGRDLTHPWKLAAHVEAAGFADVGVRDNEDYDAWSSDAGKRLLARMFSTGLGGIAAKGGITAEERDRLVGNLEGIFDGSTIMGIKIRWVWGRRPE